MENWLTTLNIYQQILSLIKFLLEWIRQLFCKLSFKIHKQKAIFYPSKRAKSAKAQVEETPKYYRRAKPEWVKQEVIRLAVLLPNTGCRKIADNFNRLYKNKREMTVGKTYTNDVIKNEQYAIQVLQRKIKHKKSKPFPPNKIWSMDLTYLKDDYEQNHLALGIIDNGTRRCLALTKINQKTSIILFKILLNCIEKYGKPKAIRTDNEACFTSRLFRTALKLLGIKHQRSEKCCPWQNGKVERFFGTLKQKLQHYVLPADGIKTSLIEFTFWYNHLRPHQHLNGKTPMEQWAGKSTGYYKQAKFMQFWNSNLAGFYLAPDG